MITKECANPDCAEPGRLFEARRSDAKTCSARCRQATKRRKSDPRSKEERQEAQRAGLELATGGWTKGIRRELAWRELLPPVFKNKPGDAEQDPYNAGYHTEQSLEQDATSHRASQWRHKQRKRKTGSSQPPPRSGRYGPTDPYSRGFVTVEHLESTVPEPLNCRAGGVNLPDETPSLRRVLMPRPAAAVREDSAARRKISSRRRVLRA